ncbi:MAG: hypothetical protein JEY96_17055 [Bacteroidales bacterium]|nr:hypothetical protein [Bacteroidales bacterium]
MKRILFIGLLITIFSCQNETSNEIDKEIEVINDIFLQLPEYIQFYNFSLPIPPPPPPIYNEKGEFVGIDTVAQLEILDKIEKEFKARNIDTSKIVLAVFDTLVNNDHFELNESYAVDTIFNNYHSITKSIIENEKAPMKLVLNDIVETGKYELKSYSEFPSGREIFSKKYDFNFSGVITLSRVYFNNRNDKAVIFCDYWCGIDCWTGNALFLEKIDGKWKIVNSELLWIA